MIANIGDKYTTVLDKIIQKQVEVKANTIFVLTGITPYIGIENYAEYITDLSTFDKDGNDTLFSREWFGTVFSKLMIAQNHQFVSHQQFAVTSRMKKNHDEHDFSITHTVGLVAVLPILW